MLLDELKEKAAALPMVPGVYIMRDKDKNVIYVGKAKKLRNRVSQYFQDTVSHSPKTKMMVSKIDQFDVIVAASEFEALVLECSLIKRYMPKYNILLKDDKGYPYLRLNMKDDYPVITMVNRIADDGASYYGPYGSRGVTQDLLETIRQTLRLPGCNRTFPRDIGKDRPCLNYHMNQCDGWCQEEQSGVLYRQRMEQARQLLLGNYRQVSAQIREQMLAASEDLNFELAAGLRDRLKAVEALGKKQLVTAGTLADTDVIALEQNEIKACFTVLHFSDGNLVDKEYEILPAVDEPETMITSLMVQFYLNRGYAPKFLLMPFLPDDAELLQQLMLKEFNRSPKIKVPQRGDNMRLLEMAQVNAKEELHRITTKEEKHRAVLGLLERMLGVSKLGRIESYDISNISGTDIVASMVVFADGKPRRSEYKRFAIRGLTNQDDYASMEQVLQRRFAHYCSGDAGFDRMPDLLLIDGGIVHAQTAQRVLQAYHLSVPVFGMVKDDRHRTRTLVTPEGMEIAIDAQQSVFAFVGSIQEETHRFAISYHRRLRSRRLRYSELDTIKGIGPKRKQELLKTFQSISAIRQASMEELLRILPADAANAVYEHFHKTEEG